MWYLVQSNQLECLFDHLAAVLAVPLTDPLAPEVIVVQHAGMARWLRYRLATEAGIAANIQFPLPARCIWEVLASQLALPADMDLFARPVLRWRIFNILRHSGTQRRFADLAAYLQDDRDGEKTLKLAEKIADLFDQYLVYRPDMLLDWEAGGQGEWQAELWRMLTSAQEQHRARLLQQFRKKWQADGLQAGGLPQRISIFGVSSMAPAYLDILAGVSAVTDVHLFHLNPCRHYWADLTSPAEIARRRISWRQRQAPDLSGYYDIGNPLLASLGKAGREFSLMLAGLEGEEKDIYPDPAGDTLLSQLQRDILYLEDRSLPDGPKIPVSGTDRSVRLHVCHSRLREVQVLHDSLLDLFAADPALTPRDILVMAPDIEAYGPAIRAVFDSARDNRFIPWSLADRTVRAAQPMVDAFLALLDLAGGRYTAPAVISFLEQEVVRRRFDIDGEGMATIRRWLRESGIRWSLDQDQRRDLGLAMGDGHSWAFGLRRLFLAYCSGGDAPLFRGIAPCSLGDAGNGVLLGNLAEFLDRLAEAGRVLQGEKTPAAWADALLALQADLFASGESEDEQESLQVVRAAICSLANDCRTAGFAGTLGPPVIRSYLRQELSAPAGGQAFLAGRVTFCNMVPMRSIPFAVICLLGMNDADYPRCQNRLSFDLMAANPRPGDRNRRDDDRYLFLEIVLSARRVLYLSWVGRDQCDNSPRPPSVVVAELRDYLERACRKPDGSAVSLLREHPLQPFSPRCYDGSTGSVSFAQEWFPGSETGAEPVFVPGPLPSEEVARATVDFQQLKRFWSHPVRFFLQERLGVNLRENGESLPASEPFHPDGLEFYQLISSVVQSRLAGDSSPVIRERLLAAGALPHGGFAENVWQELERQAEGLVNTLVPLQDDPLPPLEIDLELGDTRLTGWLDGLSAAGCIRFRPTAVKGRDLLQLWLDHLVLNLLPPSGSAARSYHVGRDGLTCLAQVTDPRGTLMELLSHYRQGLAEPLHFFPESARAWCEADETRRDIAAEKVWLGGFQHYGESDDPAYRLALRGREPLNRQFRELAAQVFTPLLAAREK